MKLLFADFFSVLDTSIALFRFFFPFLFTSFTFFNPIVWAFYVDRFNFVCFKKRTQICHQCVISFIFFRIVVVDAFVRFVRFCSFYEYVFFICCYLISNFVLVKLLIASPALNTQHIRSINHSICLGCFAMQFSYFVCFVSFRFQTAKHTLAIKMYVDPRCTHTRTKFTPNAINHVLIKWTITALNMNTYEYLFTIKLDLFYLFIYVYVCCSFFMDSVCCLIFFLFFADDLCTLIIIVVVFLFVSNIN